MTPLARYIKDSDAVLPYSIEWSSWVPDGETMSGSYKWAGPHWQAHDRSATIGGLDGVDDRVVVRGGDQFVAHQSYNHPLRTPNRASRPKTYPV